MASQTGSNIVVRFKEQTTPGTPVTGTGASILRWTDSPGFDAQRAGIQSAERRPSGMRGRPRLGVMSVPGTFNGELAYDAAFQGLLAGFFGADWSTDVLTPGASAYKAYTFDVYNAGLDLSEQYEWVRPVSLSINCGADGMIGTSWGLLGRSGAPLATGDSPGLTDGSASTTAGMTGVDAVVTGSSALNFSSIVMNLSRGGGVQALLGTHLSDDVYFGDMEVSGTVTGTVSTLALLAAVAAETSVTLTTTVDDPAGNEYEIALSNVIFPNFASPIGGDVAKVASANWMGGGDTAIVVTRTPAA